MDINLVSNLSAFFLTATAVLQIFLLRIQIRQNKFPLIEDFRKQLMNFKRDLGTRCCKGIFPLPKQCLCKDSTRTTKHSRHLSCFWNRAAQT